VGGGAGGSVEIPIVRTTTKYEKPAQRFSKVHFDIIKQIRAKAQEEFKIDDFEANNALIEIYDTNYRKMGFHSDQALDIADDSYIAVYSCYNNMGRNPDTLRKLKIKNKETDENSEVLMDHNSVVMFSTDTNYQHLHKIVLEGNKHDDVDTLWLGITFRLSKTYIKIVDEIAYFTDGRVLAIANEKELKEFYKLRGAENRSKTKFEYPTLTYTISSSDIMEPI
jgi:hypothetical protein